MLSNEVGESIPPDTAHAVSVSLPTWKANVGYEEGEDWVLSKMKTGYPRFFVHKAIQAFANAILRRYGSPMENASLFSSHAVAERCVEFFLNQVPSISLDKSHTGDGVSSRRAEYCHKAFNEGHLATHQYITGSQNSDDPKTPSKGPRRYQKKDSVDLSSVDKTDGKESVQFVEERFGRNLDVSLAASAKLAIRRRIAGALTANVDLKEALKISETPTRTEQVSGLCENDVYLYPCGMSSIFNTHRSMVAIRGQLKSISFGFPYIDTLKILEKWGPGCLFYGHGEAPDLDDLEHRCEAGEKYLALFCEFPGNPLLKTPDLRRIRALADRYDFAVVVDETIGNFINVHVLPYADIVVSSLTKVFTGECNVMGGSSVLNPQSRYYSRLKEFMASDYEDNYWHEDAIFMERNSRDFVSRIARMNQNAEAVCDTLQTSPIVKEVYYPKYSPTRANYDYCRNPNGGYGGLLSVTFKTTAQAVTFFDKLETAKGPSLGTNFTLSSPYVILAHYGELEWAAQYGIEADLVRISVGLEDAADLRAKVERALAVAANAPAM
ncbi:hypothetical protein P7C71_g2754, partial [Lecanoromycetidae sp. Uapishka_2]